MPISDIQTRLNCTLPDDVSVEHPNTCVAETVLEGGKRERMAPNVQAREQASLPVAS